MKNIRQHLSYVRHYDRTRRDTDGTGGVEAGAAAGAARGGAHPTGPAPIAHGPGRALFRTHVAGQAQGTREAKWRDLACFLHFYTQYLGHDEVRA